MGQDAAGGSDAALVDGMISGRDGGADGGGQNPTLRFRRHTVDATAAGPAYAAVGDVDRDGKLDLVIAHLGRAGGFTVPAGQVTLHTRGASLDAWTKTTVVAEAAGLKFPGQPRLVDLDSDGDLDLIQPAGFLVCTAIPGGSPCGALRWLEQTAAGWTSHDIVPAGSQLFYHHAELADLDGDAVLDLVTVGEQKGGMFGGTDRAVTQWFKGTTTAARFETTAREIGAGLGSFPRVIDLDGDGDLDIASAEFFGAAPRSFAWFERIAAPSSTAPAGTWSRHVIDDTSGPAIMLTPVSDLFGDGKLRVVGSNHTNTRKTPPDPQESAIFVLTPGADPKQPWSKQKISSGIESGPGSAFAPQAAPGIFGLGDIDGDSDLDLVVSGDGDPHVYWLEQVSPGGFVTHVLADMMAQAGGTLVVDLDGNGQSEIVITAYEGNAVYVFERE